MILTYQNISGAWKRKIKLWQQIYFSSDVTDGFESECITGEKQYLTDISFSVSNNSFTLDTVSSCHMMHVIIKC